MTERTSPVTATLKLPAIAPRPCECCGREMHLNRASYSCDQQSTETYHIDDLLKPGVAQCRQQWQPMESAPKDREILVRRHNDVCHEHYVVWWTGDKTYPWQSENTAYPDGRLDEWCEIPRSALSDTSTNREGK